MSYQIIPNLTYSGRPVYYSTAPINQTKPPSNNQTSTSDTSWFPSFSASGGNKKKSYRRKIISKKHKSMKSRK